jgi:hypothetical protein
MIPNGSNIMHVSSFAKKNGNVGISSDQSYFKLPYYTESIFDEKDFKRFVKGVEKEVRRSDEYSHYLGILHDKGLNSCAILGNVVSNEEKTSKLTLEFHHYPFTLYDIVAIVTENMLMNKEPVSTFLVAKKVMQLHGEHKVGLVPLCKTVHQLVHAGEIFINLNMVYGRYDKFIEEYQPDSDYITIYNGLVEMSKANKPYSENDILALYDRIVNDDELEEDEDDDKKIKSLRDMLEEDEENEDND